MLLHERNFTLFYYFFTISLYKTATISLSLPFEHFIVYFSFKYSFSHNLLILSAKIHISSKSPKCFLLKCSKSPKCFCLKCSKSPKCLSFNRDEENFPRKKTRTNWICPDKFVRHDINRWLWEDYEAAGQTTGQIQFVRVIFLGHKCRFGMA